MLFILHYAASLSAVNCSTVKTRAAIIGEGETCNYDAATAQTLAWRAKASARNTLRPTHSSISAHTEQLTGKFRSSSPIVAHTNLFSIRAQHISRELRPRDTIDFTFDGGEYVIVDAKLVLPAQ